MSGMTMIEFRMPRSADARWTEAAAAALVGQTVPFATAGGLQDCEVLAARLDEDGEVRVMLEVDLTGDAPAWSLA